MATINPSQDYDIIHTLTFDSTGGNMAIRLFMGSNTATSGTVYYRAGTSGSWTSLSVSGTSTTFPVTDTTMQVAHDWNKSGDDYMTPSWQSSPKQPITISISQKAVLSGSVGAYFMYAYAYTCSSLTSLDVPDTSNVTSVVGSNFMSSYALNCTSLTSLSIPDTSSLTSVVGNNFMYRYAYNCSSLTSLSVPDTSNVTSVGSNFMFMYAYNCSSLTSLDVPDISGVTSVPSGFMREYAYGCSSLTSLSIPDTSSVTSVGSNFMYYYAYGCSSLTKLILPNTTSYFSTTNVGWGVPSARLGLLKGYVKTPSAKTAWEALTVSGKTLYTNYIRSTSDIVLDVIPFNSEIFRRRLL